MSAKRRIAKAKSRCSRKAFKLFTMRREESRGVRAREDTTLQNFLSPAERFSSFLLLHQSSAGSDSCLVVHLKRPFLLFIGRY